MPRVGRHPSAAARRAKVSFIALRGIEDAVCRAHEIARLPTKVWHGTRVYAITCRADFGKGPHEVYLTPAVLWHLIDLRMHRCPYH